MEEIWKDIEGYEGLYQVSNFGRVKSLSRPYKNQYGDFGMKPEKIKKCSKCGFIGTEDLFRKNRSVCKKCNAEARKKYYEENRDIILLKKKEYTQRTKEHRRKYNSEYWAKNKEELAQKNKIWRENNKEHIKEKNKEKTLNGKNKQYNKTNYEKHKEARIKSAKEYYLKHKERLNKLSTKRKREELRANPTLRLMRNIQREINHHIRKKHKTSKYLELFGWTIEDLVKRLESQFKDGMTWDNYGEWHLDHIIPQSWYDFAKEEEIIKCWSLDNLQPLWAVDNISKGNRYAG